MRLSAGITCSLLVWQLAGAGLAQADAPPLEEIPPGRISPLPAPASPRSHLLAPRPMTAGGPFKPGRRQTDVVRERYPDGRVKLERHVALDEQENYVNHGPWILFDEGGQKVIEGQYQFGLASGQWTRWFRSNDVPLLQEPPYISFEPPFVSQATFQDGKLEGTWTFYDRQQRKVSEISFSNDRRDGPATWWHPSGHPMRELTFVDGRIEGDAKFYRENGQLARHETYQRGRKVAPYVKKYPNGSPQCRGTYRYPEVVIVNPDNWWACELATFELQGEGQKEGDWVLYYPNGQKMMTGHYDADQPIGEFVWWYESGQRSLMGQYVAGYKHGRWTWWHDNGVKLSQGGYREDLAVGRWSWWDSEGQLDEQISDIAQLQQEPRRELTPVPFQQHEQPVSVDYPQLERLPAPDELTP